MDTTVIYKDQAIMNSNGKLASRGLLIILSENFFGKSFIVDQLEVSIGRGDESGFIIDDKMISRLHCKIGVDEENHFYIEDLDSTNSSFINGKILKKRKPLYYGDKINLGDTILRFFREESK